MRHGTSVFLLATAVVLTSACAAHAPDASRAAATPSGDATTAEVRNIHSFPVTIYLTQAGMRHRLGVVESLSSATFPVSESVLAGGGEFRLVASPLGPHPTLVSEIFRMRSGQQASWNIQESTTPGVALTSVVAVN